MGFWSLWPNFCVVSDVVSFPLLVLPCLNRHVDPVVLLVRPDVFGDTGPIAAGTEGSRGCAAVPIIVT